MPYADFLLKKIDVAVRLSNGEGGTGYTDSAIILAALSSGISADIWPGERIDQKRFIELWAAHSNTKLGSLNISVPLLSRELRTTGKHESAEKLESARAQMFGLGNVCRILTGPEVDMTESEIDALGLELSIADIREFSYPALFYRHIRCGLMHEFHLTESAAWNPQSKQPVGVSYVNRQLADDRIVRLIHFEISWLGSVLKSITSKLGPDGPKESPRPTRWWIDG